MIVLHFFHFDKDWSSFSIF